MLRARQWHSSWFLLLFGACVSSIPSCLLPALISRLFYFEGFSPCVFCLLGPTLSCPRVLLSYSFVYIFVKMLWRQVSDVHVLFVPPGCVQCVWIFVPISFWPLLLIDMWICLSPKRGSTSSKTSLSGTYGDTVKTHHLHFHSHDEKCPQASSFWATLRIFFFFFLSVSINKENQVFDFVNMPYGVLMHYDRHIMNEISRHFNE